MPGCAVSNCVNHNRKTKGTDIRYHRFPKNPDILKQWIIACKRQDKINLKNACVCSTHFELSCYETTTFPLSQQLMNYTPKNNVKLKHDAVPSLNFPRKALKRVNLESSERLAKRGRIMFTDDSPVPSTFNINNEQISKSGDAAPNVSSDKIAEASSSEEINRKNEQQLLALKTKILPLEKKNVDVAANVSYCDCGIINFRKNEQQLLALKPKILALEKKNVNVAANVSYCGIINFRKNEQQLLVLKPKILALEKKNVDVAANVSSNKIAEASSSKDINRKNEQQLLALKTKIVTLEKEKSNLINEVRELKRKQKHSELLLSKCFSAGQVKRILNPNNKNAPWSPEDIASAISLRSVSPKAYRYLRALGHPLPALSTLRKWASTFSLRQGILTDVISLMRNKASELTDDDKLDIDNGYR